MQFTSIPIRFTFSTIKLIQPWLTCNLGITSKVSLSWKVESTTANWNSFYEWFDTVVCCVYECLLLIILSERTTENINFLPESRKTPLLPSLNKNGESALCFIMQLLTNIFRMKAEHIRTSIRPSERNPKFNSPLIAWSSEHLKPLHYTSLRLRHQWGNNCKQELKPQPQAVTPQMNRQRNCCLFSTKLLYFYFSRCHWQVVLVKEYKIDKNKSS